ncbi:MAG: hypothetical protein MJ124_09135 [Lachnospiraceae bacterium]|nr:hypothetical protein [Lachnospiraceae bacterium]
MLKSLETIAAILCAVALLFVIPLMLQKKSADTTRNNFYERQASELAYKIDHEHRVDIADLYNFNGEIVAYEDNVGGASIIVTYDEILDAMRADGNSYVFTEKYVRLTYGDEQTITIRLRK